MALMLVLFACSTDTGAPDVRPSTRVPPGVSDSPTSVEGDTDAAAVVGMWMTADGQIRQELLPGGRYQEARGDRERAYTGRYTVTGSHIDYVDDTGFTATGDIRDGVLFHGGMKFFRAGDPRITGRQETQALAGLAADRPARPYERTSG